MVRGPYHGYVEIVCGVLVVDLKDCVSGLMCTPSRRIVLLWCRSPQHLPEALVVTWAQARRLVCVCVCFLVDGGTITLDLGLSLQCQLFIALRVIRDSRQVLKTTICNQVNKITSRVNKVSSPLSMNICVFPFSTQFVHRD